MKINLSLLFYLKKRKSYKNGPVEDYGGRKAFRNYYRTLLRTGEMEYFGR